MAAEDKIVEAAKKTIHENEAKWAYEIWITFIFFTFLHLR
jgi:hypothetical protein